MITILGVNRKIRKEVHKTVGRQELMRKTFGFTPASIERYVSHKRSSTLFVLGSGESICQLGKDQWDEVSACDSFGLNYWMIHPHVPNFYSFEIPEANDARKVLVSNLKACAKSYQDTEVIFKAEAASRDMEVIQDFAELTEIAELADVNNWSISVPAYFTVRTEAQLICMLKTYDKVRFSLQNRSSDLFFHKRASIVFVAMFAYDLGFTDVVFCGVDGFANSGYFYEQSGSDVIAEGMVIPCTRQKKGTVHRTMNSEVGALTADVCLRLIDKHLFRRKGVRMWVGTKNSMLLDWMPSWKWGKV